MVRFKKWDKFENDHVHAINEHLISLLLRPIIM